MYSLELQIAVEAAKKASAAILRHIHTDYQVEEKGQDHPVTIADREANELIKQTLLTQFPEDGWLSEETRDDSSRLKKQRVWIVDPLDGTKEFIQKIPEFAVSIGLAVDGQPVVGVLLNPLTSELFTATKGGGAFLNGKSILVSKTKNLKEATILASRSETKRGEWEAYREDFMVQTSGGMACKLAVVACGKADGSFTLNPKTEWDFCAGSLILCEAGGRVTQLNGEPFIYNKPDPRATGMIYGNPFIYDQLVVFLKSHSVVS